MRSVAEQHHHEQAGTLTTGMRPDFSQALAVETAALQAEYPTLAGGLGRAHALVMAGAVFVEDDGHTARVRSTRQPDVWYDVNGVCPCDSTQFSKEPCKHRLAVRLHQRVQERLLTPPTPLEPVTPPRPQTITIDPKYRLMIQGKPFVLFEGLLQAAHTHGLVSLETTVVSVSDTLAVCQSTARFQDGRVFTDMGDATKENVTKKIAPHFPRMAGTRSAARALRRALNIRECAFEELGEIDVDTEKDAQDTGA